MKKLLTPIYAVLLMLVLQACDNDDGALEIDPPPPPPPQTVTTITDIASGSADFETLTAALTATGLDATLADESGTFTVFAPTDAAFAALPDGTLDSLLLPENKDQLVAILTYHVVAGKTKSKQLAGKVLTVETVNGATVSIDGTDGVAVNGANVVQADVKAKNGLIHVVDAVLLPPSQ